MEPSKVVKNVLGKRVPTQVSRQVTKEQVIEREWPNLQPVKCLTQLHIRLVARLEHFRRSEFLTKRSSLLLTVDPRPPFTVSSRTLVLFKSKLVTCEVIRTIRLRQITILQAILRTDPRLGRRQLTVVSFPPCEMKRLTRLTGLGWQSVPIVVTLLTDLGLSPCNIPPTFGDLNRNILPALVPWNTLSA